MARRPTVSPLPRRLAAALDAVPGLGAGAHLLLAASGGPDSTALVIALAEVAAERGLVLTVAHVDHALRGADSDADRAHVGALATRLGLRYVATRARVVRGPGLEDRARRARYRALRRLAAATGAAWIVTGHTRDDQAETVLLRLLRGAGRRGLGGIAPVRGTLLRPLLGVSRADVRRFLADRGAAFRVDVSNADLRHTRNRVRRLALPLLEAEFNPRLAAQLAALAARWRDEDGYLAGVAEDRRAALTAAGALDRAVAREPAALARRIVQGWLTHRLERIPAAPAVERVLALARGAVAGPLPVPGGAMVTCEAGRLVCRPAGEAPAPFALPIDPGGSVTGPAGGWRLHLGAPRPRRPGELRGADAGHVVFDAAALPRGLVVRSRRPGDRIHLAGIGTRKVHDVLIDAKVPRLARAAVPLLDAGGVVLWVAGVARGSAARLGPDTERVVDGWLEPAVAGPP